MLTPTEFQLCLDALIELEEMESYASEQISNQPLCLHLLETLLNKTNM